MDQLKAVFNRIFFFLQLRFLLLTCFQKYLMSIKFVIINLICLVFFVLVPFAFGFCICSYLTWLLFIYLLLLFLSALVAFFKLWIYLDIRIRWVHLRIFLRKLEVLLNSRSFNFFNSNAVCAGQSPWPVTMFSLLGLLFYDWITLLCSFCNLFLFESDTHSIWQWISEWFFQAYYIWYGSIEIN